MDFKELVSKNRTYRRYYQEVEIKRETLEELIELARLTGSGGNRQPLKYFLANDQELNSKIFANIAWAAALKDWHGPEEGERPTAYVIIIEDKSIGMVNPRADLGIVAQTILLGATEKGYGGCMFASFKKKEIREILNLPEDKYDPLLVIALGKPKEKVILEELGPDGNVNYWRDEEQVHHVPKRSLKDLIIG